MKVGILLPIAETDSGTILRYSNIRDAALQPSAIGSINLDRRSSPLPVEWSATRYLGRLDVALGSGRGDDSHRARDAGYVHGVPQPGTPCQMADAVDEVSEGRLTLGLGAGWHEPEFSAFGYPFDHLASRFEDALRIIAPLVGGNVVDYQGVYERAVDCVSLPRGPRPNGPPILIGASRPRMLRLTAELADAWNTCWLGRAAELRAT